MAEKIRKTFRNSSGQPVSGISSTLSLHNVDTGAILSNFIELGTSGSYETTAEVPHGTWALYISGVKSADEFVVDPSRTSSVSSGTYKDVLLDRVVGSTLSIYQFLRLADSDGASVNETMLSDAITMAENTGSMVEVGGAHAGGSVLGINISTTKNFAVSSASGYRIFIDLKGALLSFTGTPWSFNGVRPCFMNGRIAGSNNNSFPITFDRGADFEYIDFFNCNPTLDVSSTFRTLLYGCRGIPGQQFTDVSGDITSKVDIVGSPDSNYGTIADIVMAMADTYTPNTSSTSTQIGSSNLTVKRLQKFITGFMGRTMDLVGWMVGWTQATFIALKYLADNIYPFLLNTRTISASSIILSDDVCLINDSDSFRSGYYVDKMFRGYVEQPYNSIVDYNMPFSGDHYRIRFAFNALTATAPPSQQTIKTHIQKSYWEFLPSKFEILVKRYYKLANGDIVTDGHITPWRGDITVIDDYGNLSVSNGGVGNIDTYKPANSTYNFSLAEGILYAPLNNGPSKVTGYGLL